MKSKNSIPPESARRFLNRFLRDELAEEVQGDLEEQFQDNLERFSPYRAKMKYWLQVLNYLRPFAMKHFKSTYSNINNTAMLRNYLKISFRNILRHKFYSAITILGLALGIAISFYITIYILDEASYDRFNEHIDRMYRLEIHGKIGGEEVFTVNTAPVIAGAIAREIPEIEQSLRMEQWDDVLIRWQDKSFVDNDICIVDSNFFSFFTYRLKEGDIHTALAEPMSVVVTEKTAGKIFAKEDPIGKLVRIGNDDNHVFKVTGVVSGPPENSHFHFNYLISMSSYKWMAESDRWLNNHLSTYFIVHPGANLGSVQDKLNEMVLTYVGPELTDFIGIPISQFLEQDGAYGYIITPVKDIHLHSYFEDEEEVQGNIQYIRIFAAVGFFILIIAAINFMNLSTARSSGRAKEVGLRKTFGSLKNQLAGQFLVESILFSLLALFIAVLMIIPSLTWFNRIAGKSFGLSVLLDPSILGNALMIALVLGLVSGIYPAFFLTAFRAIDVLKGAVSRGLKGKGLRGTLVTLQFSVSIIMIICTLLVYKQLQYTKNKDLGFDKERVLVIPNMNKLGNGKTAFKEDLMNREGIKAASFCSHVIPGATQMTVFKKPGEEEDYMVSRYWADYEQVEVLGLHIKEGRDFSRDFPSDSTAILVNEALVLQFGFDNPVGSEIISFGNGGERIPLHIVGVISDFNFESLRQKIRPLMIGLAREESMMAVRYTSEDPAEAIKTVEAAWKSLAPDDSFEFGFLDQNFNSMYLSDRNLGRLITIFTFFAMFIACMGLFGLSAFIAEQRTREIGIRKALGASRKGIIGLVSKEFTRFVIISFFISIIPAWYIMNDWLQGFAYRVEIGFFIFLAGGLIALFMAILSVGYQSLKAAGISPAETLRYE